MVLSLSTVSLLPFITLFIGTQCKRGYVSDLYATGKALAAIGIVPGADMTGLCALTKLSYLLGKGRSVAEVRRLMTMNLRGELTILPFVKSFEQLGVQSYIHNRFLHTVINSMGAETDRERKLVESALLPHIVCATAGMNDLDAFEKLSASTECDINATDYESRTALHVAASSGHFEMVERLIKIGASVHSRDKYDNSPLFLACAAGHIDVVDLLITSGANLDVTGSNVMWRFYQAIQGGSLKIVQCFVKAGVDASVPFLGLSASELAKSSNHEHIYQYLVVLKR